MRPSGRRAARARNERRTRDAVPLILLLLTFMLALFSAAGLSAAEAPRTSALTSTNTAARTESLSAKDAKQALEKAHDPETGPGPGTWRYVTVEIGGFYPTNLYHITNIFYEWHSPGKHALRRTERFDNTTTNSRPHVQVSNEEGSWALHDNVAILFPRSKTKASRGIVKTPGGFDWYLDPIGLDTSDRELAGDIEITGERFQQAGHSLFRITVRYGEKSKAKFTRMIKKRIPIFFRPFFKVADLKKLVDEAMPVRHEAVIDPNTYIVIVWRAYRGDGLLVSETRGWQPWRDLPPEDYIVPKGFTIFRPRSLEEAQRLDSQIQDAK